MQKKKNKWFLPRDMENLLPEDSDLVASSYSWLAYLGSSDLYDSNCPS